MAAEWMPMTIFVFLYVLTIRTVYKVLSKVSDMISKVFSKMNPEEDALIEDMKRLISEQQQFNAQDEFPKYARLQRKIDSIKDNVTQYESTRKKTIGKHKVVSKVIVLVIIIVIHISFLLMYRKEPVIVLPQQWFYPLHTMLSFPTGIPGAIGLPCWMVTCNKIIQQLII